MAKEFEAIRKLVEETVQNLKEKKVKLSEMEKELLDKIKRIKNKKILSEEDYEELCQLTADLSYIYNKLEALQKEILQLLAEKDMLDKFACGKYLSK